LSASLVAALAAGVVAGLASSRRLRLGRRARRAIAAGFAATVAATLFSVGAESGVADYTVLPLALLYAAASSLAAVIVAWLLLRLL